MLDSETKSRIDTARGILVGKIPNPQAQVEQITIAMIYKFMDDMDRQVEEAGGKRKFFSGTYSRYSWQHLMSPKLGGLEVLNLYSDAIQKMDLNPNIPLLFREIFKNAYLPYKDPETLRSFLKTINGFTYDHSERLGDAFEYLLSILGSQGDAGQFRTPRHIIDFMVYITDPQKGETILDPSCGTAGFLISSYKHILKNNSSEFLEKKEDSLAFGNDSGIHFSGDKLTPDDRRMLPKNIMGYDISPDMVRLSLVNLYLHGFAEPNIFEYDTLTSEDKWNEYYNVILANPPFMSPKGGIRPHKRFSIESSRSEVLFVDYIAEHLTLFGRAAVIVPEGIIFHSGTAYKSLRKMLIEKALYAVVSLPSGVFNPYAGVKTSILLLDKQLAQKTDNILFVKIENDGYDLGAQRRQIDKNDLPQSANAIKEYKECIETGKNFEIEKYTNLLLAPKTKISENGDYNLSGERYREVIKNSSSWPLIAIEEICSFQSGLWKGEKEPLRLIKILRNTNFGKNGYLDISNVAELYVEERQLDSRLLQYGDIILEKSGGGPTQPVGRVVFFNLRDDDYSFSNFTTRMRVIDEGANPFYVWLVLNYCYQCGYTERLQKQTSGIRNLDNIAYKKTTIPLPPLEVQKEIVAEIEGYQKIIDAARQIVDNYKPRIEIDPKWEVVRVDEVFSKSDKTINPETIKGAVTYIGLENITQNTGELTGDFVTKTPSVIRSLKNIFQKGSILYGKLRPNLNKVWLADRDGICSTDIFVIKPNSNKIISGFYANIFRSESFNERVLFQIKGTQLPRVGWTSFADLKIPFPPLEVQKEIVARIEHEQELVNANKELIKIFEEKIKSKISSVWGEESE